MKYKISRLQEKDVVEVVKFHNKYLGKRDFINEIELLSRLKTNRGIFLVTKDEKGEIIGLKLAFIENDVCLGRGIAVDKNLRRLGIGKELVSIFEVELKKFPRVKKYVFASSTPEGVPFHIKLGYRPSVLLQSEKKDLLENIDFNKFTIREKCFNKEYNVYQIYLESKENLDLNFLKKLKIQYPKLGITYLFEKIL